MADRPHNIRPDTGSFSTDHFAALRRRDRWTGAITVLLIIAMLALAIFTEPTPTNTCQPIGTLTKATL